MPSLASMRSIDPVETFQPLGPATRPAPPAAPAPASKPTGTPGVIQLPDGKLATQLPLPGSKPAVKLESGRIPQVGDWVRVLSGQHGIPETEAMIGGVFQLTLAGSVYVRIGRWSFQPPGIIRQDGELMTEFAEAPK